MDSNYWSKRVTRRRVLRGGVLAAGGLTAAALLGCSDDEEPGTDATGTSVSGTSVETSTSTTVAGETPTAGGELVVPNVFGTDDVYDPHISGFLGAFLYGNYASSTIVRTSPDGTEIQPDLVESWEVPGDGSEYLLKVRQGVKWHNKAPINGRELTAEDVAFSIERITGKLDPENSARYARKSTLPFLESATAIDDTTVSVKMTQPTGTFLNGMSDYRNTIIPADFVDQGGDFGDFSSLVGTGPYITGEKSDDGTVTWTKNPDYYNPEHGWFDSIRWVAMQDQLAILTALSQKQVHLFVGPNKQVREQRETIAPDTREESWIFPNQLAFFFNTQREVFADPRVRRALQLAMDYQYLNNTLYGEGEWIYQGPLPAAFPEALSPEETLALPGYNPETKEADLAEAKKLMAAAGFPDGAFTWSILGSSTGDTSAIYQDQWKRAWPDMDIQLDLLPQTETAALFTRFATGEFDGGSNGAIAFPDGALALETFYASNGGRNFSKWSDEALDGIIKQALAALDADERKSLVGQAETILLENVPAFGLGTDKTRTLFDNSVGGMNGFGRALGGGNYHDTYIWSARTGYFRA